MMPLTNSVTAERTLEAPVLKPFAIPDIMFCGIPSPSLNESNHDLTFSINSSIKDVSIPKYSRPALIPSMIFSPRALAA